jgi:uncharacterized protein YdeI (YjbR/CyaY-like superfamily)
MKRAKNVEEYLSFNEKDRELLEAIRTVILDTELEECIKWGAPTYTYKNKNVIGLAAFKNYVGVWFHEGALLSDFASKLINAQEGKTKALRQWRMANDEELDKEVLRAYIIESMENIDKGKKVAASPKKELVLAPELQAAFDQDAELKGAYEQLSAFRQREYSEHILDAKREATKLKRLEKIIPMIKQGIGLMDKYR